MKQKVVPGFKALFGQSTLQYDQIAKNHSSIAAIDFAIAINSELYAELPYKENQQRILAIFRKRLTAEQIRILDFHLQALSMTAFGEEAFELFHRRYLIAFIIKELKANRPPNINDNVPGIWFSFLLTYLLVVDEEHARDQPPLDKGLSEAGSEFIEYKMIWPPFIRQYQFNESVSPLFELFKYFAWCSFVIKKWRPYLKKYLERFDFVNIGQLGKSYAEIFKAIQRVNTNNEWLKLVQIVPPPNTLVKHLQFLCSNSKLGNNKTSLIDIKKQPLFLSNENSYKIIDGNFLYKHCYRGPFFDLVKTTGLEKDIGFNAYSGTVSKKVMEEICFKTVLETLAEEKAVLIHEQENESTSDGYFRIGNIIFLIEFKAYILKDDQIEEPDFEKLKGYIDENFIKKESGKPKGIGQLLNQINLLRDGKLNADALSFSEYNRHTIYPVICHNDFHFSLPGINEYLNTEFFKILDVNEYPNFEIKNLAIIDLNWMFDLAIRNGKFTGLAQMIDKYRVNISEFKDSFSRQFSPEVFLKSKMSFDEMYQSIFIKTLPDIATDWRKFYKMIETAGITQALMDETV